jgi:hypothetical protein
MKLPLPRFLVDECLSTTLPLVAHQLGFDCSHINHLGLVSIKDWHLVETIVDGNWTLVTNNAIEWRGRYRSSTTLLIHPGVVFVIPNVRRLEQQRLFATALNWVRGQQDPGNALVGRALDITADPAGQAIVTSYDLP